MIEYGNRLRGRVALVTGGAQGMGEAFARVLAAAGARVVVSDINEQQAAAVARSIGASAAAVRHDVTSLADWAAVIAFAEQTFGPVSILVNNAGIAIWGPLEDATEDECRRMFEVDQMGVFFGLKAIVPTMRKAGGGAVVNVASAASFKGTDGLSLYSSCKWAVRGMTKTAAIELGRDNIRVNSVHPGMIDTAMTTGMPDPDDIPIKRKGSPEDVGNAVLFLVSDESSYITGADLTVDGGLTLAAAH